jgi:TMEM175 potassium channel family protein
MIGGEVREHGHAHGDARHEDAISGIPVSGMRTARMEALVDGVFAIVVTLLIFDLKVPQVDPSDGAAIARELGNLWPKYLVYALSFVTLGVYWVGHHNQFYYIKRADRGLLWINILFLMFIALIPFTAQLMSAYPNQPLAVAIYGMDLVVCSAGLFWNWKYGIGNHGLVNAPVDGHLDSVVTRRILTPPAFYIVGIILALLGPTYLSIAIYVLVPLAYILPAHIDIHWRGDGGR